MNRVDHGLTIDEYHAHPALSRSMMAMAGDALTPAHFHVAREQPKDSEALRFGNAFHKFLLEPDLFKKQHVMWHETKSCGVKFLAEESKLDVGQFLVVADWMPNIKAMAKAIMADPLARKILGMKGEIEPTYFWSEGDTEYKTRPDYYANGWIVDIKKTENKRKSAHESDFITAAVDYNYDLQAFMCLRGIEAVTGERPKSFTFFVVEDAPPYGFNIIEFPANEDSPFLTLGELKFNKWTERYKRFMDSQDCYAPGAKRIEPENWLMEKTYRKVLA